MLQLLFLEVKVAVLDLRRVRRKMRSEKFLGHQINQENKII